MAMIKPAFPAVHKVSTSQDYIKALANYFKVLPSRSEPAMRPPGVTMRGGRLLNMPNPNAVGKHPSARPPAEHIVKMLAYHATVSHRSAVHNGIQIKPAKPQIIHPGKALALKSVKAIHLGSTHIPKVSA